MQRTLHERSDLRHSFELIERTRRIGSGGIARRVEIVEVLAIVPLALEIKSRRQTVYERAQGRRVADARTRTVIDPIEIDVRGRDRILEIATDAKECECCFTGIPNRPSQRGARLVLGDVLAGVSTYVERRDGITIGAQLGERQGAGVIGFGVIADVGHESQRPCVGERQLHAGIEHSEIGGTVVARAIIVEPRYRQLRGAAADA